LGPLPNPGHRHDIEVRKCGRRTRRRPWEAQMIGFSFRKLMAVCAVTVGLGWLVSTPDARAGGGFSAGSRGSRTFSAPPTTNTAPSVSPMQRSVTQPTRPGTVGSAPAAGGFFSRPGLLGGLAAGFLGAGLFGM